MRTDTNIWYIMIIVVSSMKTNWFLRATERISNLLFSYAYKCMARQRPTYFSRGVGKIGFTNLIAISINFLVKSTQTELDHFFERILQKSESVSKQAFAEARFKLTVDAFRLLFEDTAKLASSPGLATFKGYRPLANDGTVLMLEDTVSLRGYYGAENGCAAARGSVMVDVLNQGLILDAQIDKLSCSERELAMRHIEVLKELPVDKPLMMYDRGYASADMFTALLADNILFLFRLQRSFNAEIDRMPLGDRVRNITVKGNAFRLRVVKFRLKSGEIETLITNLPSDTISTADLNALYNLRWGVETVYGMLKDALQIENFSGTSQLIVAQDFYATMFLKNMATFAKLDSDEMIEQNHNPDNLYAQKTNENLLLGILKDKLVLALLDPSPKTQAKKIQAIIQQAARHPIPVRPNRSFPRRRKHSKRFYNSGRSSL